MTGSRRTWSLLLLLLPPSPAQDRPDMHTRESTGWSNFNFNVNLRCAHTTWGGRRHFSHKTLALRGDGQLRAWSRHAAGVVRPSNVPIALLQPGGAAVEPDRCGPADRDRLHMTHTSRSATSPSLPLSLFFGSSPPPGKRRTCCAGHESVSSAEKVESYHAPGPSSEGGCSHDEAKAGF